MDLLINTMAYSLEMNLNMLFYLDINLAKDGLIRHQFRPRGNIKRLSYI